MWQRLKNLYHLVQAFLAAVYYHFPSKQLTVIGITGTDGKTSTANLIFHILKTANYKVSMISSLGAQIGSKRLDTGFHVTTPSPFKVQYLLRKALDSGNRYFVLEATSHGLEQNRLAFVNFNIALVTNITSDHMDYHKNWGSYALAKAKLFKHAKFSILNLDDDSYDFLKGKASGKVYTYSMSENADFNLKKLTFKPRIREKYNLYNLLAAKAVASILGVADKKTYEAANTFSGVKGRMQNINVGQKYSVIIDFAHTTNALAQVLDALNDKKSTNSRLIIVFGAAGERDKTKRPKMGEIAAKLADISVLTAEDPRTENVITIIGQIEQGFLKQNKKANYDYFKIPDRDKAINFAIGMAKPQDIIAILGKGHEKSMAFGNKEYAWSDTETAKKAIQRRLRNAI